MTDNRPTVPVLAVERDPPASPAWVSLREVMARFATGIVVLTAPGDQRHGMTANAFSSVSLDPPLVLSCVSREARMHSAIMSAGSFAVSVLGAEQEQLARYFADPSRPNGQAQFDSVRWEPGPRTGAPLLAGSLAWLECELVEAYGGGDHSIFLGRVLSSGRGASEDALVFFGGKFRYVA